MFIGKVIKPETSFLGSCPIDGASFDGTALYLT
jgi:hypothetical protein